MMKKFAIISTLLALAISCGTVKPLPPANNTTNVKDSTVIHIVDSVRIIPKEVIKDVVPQYDTLVMETSMTKSVSYVDTTTHTLKGTLNNKQGVTEKIVYKDKLVYKDSIQIKEIPYPVEVTKEVTKYPKTYWWFMAISILAVVYLGVKLYLKFKI